MTISTSRLYRVSGGSRLPGAEGRRPLRAAERAIVSLEGFLALCGVGGGIYLAANPMDAMPLRYLEGTWFHTWRVPGLALFFFVGICPALVAGAALRRMAVARIGHLGVGIGVVSWIVLEAAWVVVSPPLQTVMGLVGLAILALALRDLARQDPGTQESPDQARRSG